MGEYLWHAIDDLTVLISAHFHGKGDILSYGSSSEEFVILEDDTDIPSVECQLTWGISKNISSSIIGEGSFDRTKIADECLYEARFS